MDLACSLLTSCRPPGRLQKRPDDRTSNAGVAADGSRRTADAGDEQCLEVWMQQSVMYCGASCCWRGMAWWYNGYGVGLVATQNVAGTITSPFSGNNFGQVVRTHVPLSSSSII